MSALKYRTTAVGIDAIIAAMAYLWIAQKIEGAGNVLALIVWTLIVVRTLAGLTYDKTSFKKKRPAGFGYYRAVTGLALIGFLSWFGMMWTAGFYTLSAVLIEAARNKEPRAKKEGSA